MAIFRFFKMAAADMLDFWNYKVLTVWRIISAELRHMPNFVAIGQTVVTLSPILDFLKMVAATILDF